MGNGDIAHKMANKDDVGLMASLNASRAAIGGTGVVIQKLNEAALGLVVRSDVKPDEDYQQNSPTRFYSKQPRHWGPPAGPCNRRHVSGYDKQWPVDQRYCEYCRCRGHDRRKCYRLTNEKNEAVNHVDTQQPTTSANTLIERLDKLRTMD